MKNARLPEGKTSARYSANFNPTYPAHDTQAARLLAVALLGQQINPLRGWVIREHQPMTADYAIPEVAARVHPLLGRGYNIRTTILPEVEFRGVIRRNTALHSYGSPEWPRPGFFKNEEASQ